MYSLEQLQSWADREIGHQLPKTTFSDFRQPNHRLLIAIQSLRSGHDNLANSIFISIASEGPKENDNEHFAYVRSLIELAEAQAILNKFADAASYMQEALEHFPPSMSYMVSLVHLEVNLARYLYRSSRQEEALIKIFGICKREKIRFQQSLPEDAYDLISPGLNYALKVKATFYAEEGKWQQAISTLQETLLYIREVDHLQGKIDDLRQLGETEQVYNLIMNVLTDKEC